MSDDRIDDLSAKRRELVALLLGTQERDDHIRSEKTEIGVDYDVAPQQRRLWFLDQLNPGSSFCTIPLILRFDGHLDLEALNRALVRLVERHEILRTNIVNVGGTPRQRVNIPPSSLLEMQEVSSETGEDSLQRMYGDFLGLPFSVDVGVLIRACAYRTEKYDTLLIAVHHIIADGWSLRMMLHELSELYSAVKNGGPAPPDPGIQYLEYTRWQLERESKDRYGKSIKFWKDTLEGVPPLDLAISRTRPPFQSFRGARVHMGFSTEEIDEVRRYAKERDRTVFSIFLAAFFGLLRAHSGQRDFAVGVPISNRDQQEELASLLGCCFNVVAVRFAKARVRSFADLVDDVWIEWLNSLPHHEVPFDSVVDALTMPKDTSRSPIFQTLIGYQEAGEESPEFGERSYEVDSVGLGTSQFDLAMYLNETPDGSVRGSLDYCSDLLTQSDVERLCLHFRALVMGGVRDHKVSLSRLLTTNAPANSDRSADDIKAFRSVCEDFSEMARIIPDKVALEGRNRQVTFSELDLWSSEFAARLVVHGIRPEECIGIKLARDIELVVCLLGVLKAGCAFVPIDTAGPLSRVRHIVQAAGIEVLVTDENLPELNDSCTVLSVGTCGSYSEGAKYVFGPVAQYQTAYVMFTSGSTGKPKGVVVQHNNLCSFFHAMDKELPHVADARWLSVTKPTFDISVLELLYVPSRGGTLVFDNADESGGQPADFSLFFFGNHDKRIGTSDYHLVLESAQYADQRGFAAVWVPERHFHEFGGLYPNPSIIATAVAMKTTRIAVRAGSVVLPLHDPLRVAEEWAMVDQLSGGRTGVSFASGWHANDFVLAQGRFESRRPDMLDAVDVVRNCWQGKAQQRTNGNGDDVQVATYPLPYQDEIPVWLTAAGSAGTFKDAGERGLSVLTHLLGQSIDELAGKIRMYRAAHAKGNHRSPAKVTLMMHTFLGDDDNSVWEIVRDPLVRYLDVSASLVESFLDGSDSSDIALLSSDDRAVLLERAAKRFFDTSGLLGSIEKCSRLVGRLLEIGVDEFACLIDFGVANDLVMQSLDRLDHMKTVANQYYLSNSSVGNLIVERGITHLQCTPSFVLSIQDQIQDLGHLQELLIGGEAMPENLADRIRNIQDGSRELNVRNMFGPTETTIWSTSYDLEPTQESVLIGSPLWNTSCYVLDELLDIVPVGVPGELFIGGEGVTRGYLNQPRMTAEKFLPDPFTTVGGQRLYQSGDRVVRMECGQLKFLGRLDDQVKVRGHRIELGEVETAMRAQAGVQDCAAVLRKDQSGANAIVAYYVSNVEISPLGLRHQLRQSIPKYMIPSMMIQLESMPLNSSGKTDRRLLGILATEQQGPVIQKQSAPPATPGEQLLAQIWRELLEVDAMSIHDDFYDLGGHSLLVTNLKARIQDEFQVDIPLRSFFEEPTIAGMDRLISERVSSDEEMLRILDDLESES